MLAKTPPMGFNTWNTFAENINEQLIRETADKMVELGLLSAGYQYLVIDDCWSELERDPVTGRIVPDHIKFSNGMRAVSDYVHSKGLKFGMYSDAGTHTCAEYPASFDHEYLDARTFADYGADYLKYDFGNRPDTANGPLLYRRMGHALRICGRDIVFSACNWGCDDAPTWIRSAGADLYRSTGDINDTFASMRGIALSQIDKLAYACPGCFNDTDMLTVGMHGAGNVGHEGGMTVTDYKTEFALWCMFSAPLMLGCDLRKIDDVSLKLVKNRTLIRIDQDEDARPAFVASRDGDDRFVLVKLLTDKQIAVMFVNLSEEDRRIKLYLEDMGIPFATGLGLDMTSAFTGENIGIKKERVCINLAPHDSDVYICTVK